MATANPGRRSTSGEPGALRASWAGPRVRRPAIKALVLAGYLIVGQVAQFGNWAYRELGLFCKTE